jgi:hypothetical protein
MADSGHIWRSWEPLLYYIGGFAICIGLYLLSVFFYGRRKSEIAEQQHITGGLKTAVKCLSAYTGGAVFCLIFTPISGFVGSLIFYTMMGAVIAGLLAEIILSRGVRFILKNAKWILGAGAVTCLIFISIRYDWIGYARFVPSPHQVQSVSVSYAGRFQNNRSGRFSDMPVFTDPEIINIVVNSHQIIVDNRPRRDIASWSRSTWNTQSLRVEYTMRSGRTVVRVYQSIPHESLLELANLEAKDEFILATHPLRQEGVAEARANIVITSQNSLQSESRDLILDDQSRDQLFEALLADALGETLAEITDPSAPAPGRMTITLFDPPDLSAPMFDSAAPFGSASSVRSTPRRFDNANILITHEYTRTLNLLHAWGYTFPAVQYDSLYLQIYPRHHRNNNTGLQTMESRNWGSIDRFIPNRTDIRDNVIPIDERLHAHIRQSAQDRRLLYPGDIDDGRVFHLLYVYEGEITGARFVHRDRLPAELLADVAEWETILRQ